MGKGTYGSKVGRPAKKPMSKVSMRNKLKKKYGKKKASY